MKLRGGTSPARHCLRLDWEDKDVFCGLSLTFHEDVNTGERPAVLFSHTDVPVVRALDLYREERTPLA